MKILIIGFGSIAKKHVKALRTLEKNITFWALRSTSSAEAYEDVINIYNIDEINEKPDFIIVSNPTQFHKDAIITALSFNRPLFIEKPVLSNYNDAREIIEKLKSNKQTTYIACNLRFHPVIKFLKKSLSSDPFKINEVNVYCGSDLSIWRPSQDYRNSYSAKSELGGGVHLDLIHEIDYCYWLFGKPLEVKSLKRKVSDLEINSFDFASYNLIYPHFTINIILNYYRKKAKRTIEIIGEKNIEADLYKPVVSVDGVDTKLRDSFSMEETYIDQMKYFIECLNTRTTPMNSFDEAVEVLKIATHE